jgi:hypothetical protein
VIVAADVNEDASVGETILEGVPVPCIEGGVDGSRGIQIRGRACPPSSRFVSINALPLFTFPKKKLATASGGQLKI